MQSTAVKTLTDAEFPPPQANAIVLAVAEMNKDLATKDQIEGLKALIEAQALQIDAIKTMIEAQTNHIVGVLTMRTAGLLALATTFVSIVVYFTGLPTPAG